MQRLASSPQLYSVNARQLYRVTFYSWDRVRYIDIKTIRTNLAFAFKWRQIHGVRYSARVLLSREVERQWSVSDLEASDCLTGEDRHSAGMKCSTLIVTTDECNKISFQFPRAVRKLQYGCSAPLQLHTSSHTANKFHTKD